MNVASLFSEAVERYSQRDALVTGMGGRRRALDYPELAARVDELAALLRSSGLSAGDRVLLAVPMSIETYVGMLAILKAGMVIMHVDPAHGRAAVRHCLGGHPPAAVIASRRALLLGSWIPEFRDVPIRIVARSAARFHAAGGNGARGEGTQEIESRSAADTALLTFTSGSTGEPKAVARSHGFLKTQLDMLETVADPQDGDVELVAMPMFVLFNLARGTTSLLPAVDVTRPGRADAAGLARQMQKEQATRIVGSPALLERLVKHCRSKRISMPSLRLIATGGGPITPGLPEALQSVAPASVIRMVYGSSEAEPIATIDGNAVSVSDKRRMREGSGLLVGRPVEGCALRIIEDRKSERLGPFTAGEFERLAVEPGNVGEIVVSGRHVLQSYAEPECNAATKIDVDGVRWHRTGDAGYIDDSGRLWLVGRCSASVCDRHGELYPFQVEYAASAVPGIRRAALLSSGGERVLAVETRGRQIGAGCEALARCISRWHIDRIVTLRRIPVDRRHNAKVDYPALKRLFTSRRRRVRQVFAGS